MGIRDRIGGNGKADHDGIRRMFARIAPRYDFLNHVLSAGIDRRWRDRAVAESGVGRRGRRSGVRVLDTCAGTGDLALAFARSLRPHGLICGCDYTPAMLDRFAGKVRRLRLGRTLRIAAGDSLALPFRGGIFDIVSAAFGVRNVAVGAPGGIRTGLTLAFREMERVLAPGGRVVILEFSTPLGPRMGRLLRFYFRRILPVIGNLASGRDETAYSYLPGSLVGFPQGREFLEIIGEAGLEPVAAKPLSAGLVTIYVADKGKASRVAGPARRGTDGLR